MPTFTILLAKPSEDVEYRTSCYAVVGGLLSEATDNCVVDFLPLS